jgi:hypothetical protein
MAYKAESMLPAIGKPTAQATAPAGTVTPKGTPKIASIAQEGTTAPAGTKTPLSVVGVIGALVVGSTIMILASKRQD